jgi:protein-disulfide isomerase
VTDLSTPANLDLLQDPVGERDHTLGRADAPVTLVEYGDYECPDCLNAEPIVSTLRQRLGDKLRVVFRHFPRSTIHPHASAAAAAAEAAGMQGKFWVMHKALFDHQKELADLDLTHLALKAGLEVYKFQAALESSVVARRVSHDYDNALRHGLNATPTFFINGVRYRGKAEVEPMLAAIEKAMG